MVKAKNTMLVCMLRGLEVVMQVTLLFVITLLLFSPFLAADGMWKCLLISVLPVVVLYAARRTVHSGILRIVLHGVAAVFILLMAQTDSERFGCIITAAVLVIYSMSLCNQEQKPNAEKLPVGLLVLFIAAVVWGNHRKVEYLMITGFYGGCLFLVCQVLYYNFNNLNNYLLMNRDIAQFPMEQTMLVNIFLMSVLMVLCGFIVLLFSNSKIRMMVQLVGEFLQGVVVVLLRMIFSIGSDLKSETMSTEIPAAEQGIMELQKLMKDTIWTEIVQGLGMVIGIILAVIIIIGMLVWIATAFVKTVKNMEADVGADIKEFISPKDMITFRRSNRSEREEKAKGNNAKLRKLYKTIAKKSAARKGGQIKATMLPEDISEQYLQDPEREIMALYEKARYSDTQVEQHEVEAVKKYLKTL